MPCQIRNLLTRLDIVERDGARVTRGSEQGCAGRESNATNRLDEPGERVGEATRVVVEDIEGSVLVTRSGETAVPAEVYAHAEAAFGLVLADLGHVLFVETPDVDFAVDAAGGEVLAICTQGNGPGVTRLELVWECQRGGLGGGRRGLRNNVGDRKGQGVPTTDLAVWFPRTVLGLAPYLDAAFEACACRSSGFSSGHEVVDAEWVDALERLQQWEVGLGGVVDVYRRAAACGKNRLGCGRESEDI